MGPAAPGRGGSSTSAGRTRRGKRGWATLGHEGRRGMHQRVGPGARAAGRARGERGGPRPRKLGRALRGWEARAGEWAGVAWAGEQARQGDRAWGEKKLCWAGGGRKRSGAGPFYCLLLIIFFHSYSYLYTRKRYKLNGYTSRQFVKHKMDALQHDATIKHHLGVLLYGAHKSM
jgi:hypothetical protein